MTHRITPERPKPVDIVLSRKKPPGSEFSVRFLGKSGRMCVRRPDGRCHFSLRPGERAICRWVGSGWISHRMRVVPKGVRRVRCRVRR